MELKKNIKIKSYEIYGIQYSIAWKYLTAPWNNVYQNNLSLIHPTNSSYIIGDEKNIHNFVKIN